jgi:hypothetical protein
MIQFKIFRILMIVACITCFNFTFAQLSGGAKIGLNMSNLRGSSVQNNSMLIGYNIGGYVNASAQEYLKGDMADIFSLQVELTVESKGAIMDYPTIENAIDTVVPNVKESSKLNLTYVTIPILAKFTFGDPKGLNYFAEGGFYGAGLFGVTVDGEKKYDHDFKTTTDKRNYRDDFDGYDIGIIFGGGASIPFGGRKSPWRAFGNLRYSLGFSSVGEYREGTPDSFKEYVEDIKVSAISLVLGVSYKF